MKGKQQQFLIQKKLILHFDLNEVICLSSSQQQINKDFFIYKLCCGWIWGKLQKNNKDNIEKITGWKLLHMNLSIQKPQSQYISYLEYLNNYVDIDEIQKLIMNITKGPAIKIKSEIQKNIKNITIPKIIFQSIKQQYQNNSNNCYLINYYLNSGKYQLLPAFYKLLMFLKKSKRQFAIYIKNNQQQFNSNHIIEELNLFFKGQHFLYNGKNGTPLIKFDGSKGNKNFIIDNTHKIVIYCLGDKEYFASYGTLNRNLEKDPEMLKQSFKNNKSVRLFEGCSQIYANSHTILSQSACIYEINSLHTIFIDPVDYLTHQIYFTKQQNPIILTCLGQNVSKMSNFYVHVNLFDLLRDVDYFIKKVQNLEIRRAQEIQKIQNGDKIAIQEQLDDKKQLIQQKEQDNDSKYLKQNLLPILQAAIRQVDILRPNDPIGFIALYCLKNQTKLLP